MRSHVAGQPCFTHVSQALIADFARCRAVHVAVAGREHALQPIAEKASGGAVPGRWLPYDARQPHDPKRASKSAWMVEGKNIYLLRRIGSCRTFESVNIAGANVVEMLGDPRR